MAVRRPRPSGAHALLCATLASLALHGLVFCEPGLVTRFAWQQRGERLVLRAEPEHHQIPQPQHLGAESAGMREPEVVTQAPRSYNFEEYRGVYRRLISDETWPQVLRIVVVGPIGDEFRQTVEDAAPKVLGWDALTITVNTRTRWQSVKLDVRFTNPDDFCALHSYLKTIDGVKTVL
mmetsp:Transcript_51049/g.114713  ORF Transcript_51049/g.114713 Transcript_51049/m.114713 type:complete len:178 (+) Transcript_51049:70-603(+)